jgi:hypothetical protein
MAGQPIRWVRTAQDLEESMARYRAELAAERQRLLAELPRDKDARFRALFAYTLDYGGKYTSALAADVLVREDLPCPLTCREALLQVARSRWNPSETLVPFYLVVQFGKQRLYRVTERLLRAGELTEMERVRLETIRYWLDMGISHLLPPASALGR